MKEYKFLAEASFDKSKVLNGIDTSNKNKASDASMQNAFNTAFIWAGIICVIIIIVAGLTFITAAGNPSAIARAKTMIIYAVIGLAVAILSYAIVNFVINTSSGKGVGGESSGS